MKGIFFVICMCFVSFGVSAQVSESAFVNPENKYKPVPLWFWNNATVNENELLDQFRQMIRKDGYGGCAILPFGQDFKPEYLSDDYFNLYSKIIEEAKKLDVHMSLYDEYGFPSGSMGAINADGVPRFMNKYPDATIKRLDKVEYKVAVGESFEQVVPAGKLMSVVAMDTLTKHRISLEQYIRSGKLKWKVPEGAWKIMFFVCVKDGDPNVDYLDPEAVRLLSLIHI